MELEVDEDGVVVVVDLEDGVVVDLEDQSLEVDSEDQ
jgi:hypothetical protein